MTAEIISSPVAAKKDHRTGNTFRLDHGHCRNSKPTQTYQAWVDMRRRCVNTKHPAFKWYGARGIAVCEQWQDFARFLADMGECPQGLTLDRIDNNGDYRPGNCRWATRQQQTENQRNNRYLSFCGESKTVAAWARTVGVGVTTLRERLRAGWSIEDAISRPVRTKDVR